MTVHTTPLALATSLLILASCDSKPKKPSPEECSKAAENFAEVMGTPASKVDFYNECKAATSERWATIRCLGAAENLAGIDACKEKAAPPATLEAKLNLAKLFDAVSGHFASRSEGSPPHRCPTMTPDELAANSKVVPPLSVKCADGPNGNCIPTSDPQQPWEYDPEAWTEDNVFGAMGFSVSKPHRYHYAVRATNKADSFGACMFTAQAFGDLDADGVFSTFEFAGAIDEVGINPAAGLYIDQENE